MNLGELTQFLFADSRRVHFQGGKPLRLLIESCCLSFQTVWVTVAVIWGLFIIIIIIITIIIIIIVT